MAKIKMQGVRLSFPSLFNTSKFGGADTGKYEATFILDKKTHKAVIADIIKVIDALSKEELKSKVPSDKLCLKDGDEMGRDEYQGMYTLKASTKKRPLVIGRDQSPITESDNAVYAGCYVNAIVTIWAQNNQFGKRINAQLDGVQFNRNGEPFGDGAVTVNEFDAFSDEDEGFKF
jgi:hypothetical protein